MMEKKASAAKANAEPPSPRLKVLVEVVTDAIVRHPVAGESAVTARSAILSRGRQSRALTQIKLLASFSLAGPRRERHRGERGASVHWSLFQGLEIGDHVAHLAGIELEL